MNSLKAIKSSWKKTHSLGPMPIAGSKAGGAIPAVEVPSKEEVDKAAKKAAQAWVEDNKKAAAEKAQKKAEAVAKEKEEKHKKEVAEKKKKEKEKEEKGVKAAELKAATKWKVTQPSLTCSS